jgi:hypothetical protein
MLFMALLAALTAAGGRLNTQPCRGDILAALHARPEDAACQAVQGFFCRCQLALQVGVVARLLLRVLLLGCAVLGIETALRPDGLSGRAALALQRLIQLLAQRAPLCAQSALELPQLLWRPIGR